nr:hypothetical protein [Bradyrhizobium sp. Rc3b]
MQFTNRASRRCAASTVFVGENCNGNWVVREQNGAFGGLFVSRCHAFKYVLLELGVCPEAVVEVPHKIELDLHKYFASCRHNAQ